MKKKINLHFFFIKILMSSCTKTGRGHCFGTNLQSQQKYLGIPQQQDSVANVHRDNEGRLTIHPLFFFV